MSSRAWLIGALLLLQASDVVLTWRLLSSRPDVVEANPVALRVLESYGWAGAVALKAVTTAVALACVVVVSRRRPLVGQALVATLAAIMLAVVGYSAVLLARPPAGLDLPADGRSASLDRQMAARVELIRRRDEAVGGLLAGRLELSEAVAAMAGHLRDNFAALGPATRAAWPSPERPEQIARYLVAHCGEAGQGAALRVVREQLARQYPPSGVAAVGPQSWRGARTQ